jgi:hypothetical protein
MPLSKVQLSRVQSSLLGVVIGMACAGCRSAAERELEAEVARLAAAVNALRDAPHNQKTEPIARLNAEPCGQPASCEFKQICSQGYTLHQTSNEAAERVGRSLRAGRADEAGAEQVFKMIEADLARAKEMTERCVALQGELERATR